MCTRNDGELQCVIDTPGIERCTDIRGKHVYVVRMGRKCGQQQKKTRVIWREKTDESKGSAKKQNRNTRVQDCAQKPGVYLAKVEEF